jgi:hypothetical protein
MRSPVACARKFQDYSGKRDISRDIRYRLTLKDHLLSPGVDVGDIAEQDPRVELVPAPFGRVGH